MKSSMCSLSLNDDAETAENAMLELSGARTGGQRSLENVNKPFVPFNECKIYTPTLRHGWLRRQARTLGESHTNEITCDALCP